MSNGATATRRNIGMSMRVKGRRRVVFARRSCVDEAAHQSDDWRAARMNSLVSNDIWRHQSSPILPVIILSMLCQMSMIREQTAKSQNQI
jgi:hypothetical protein